MYADFLAKRPEALLNAATAQKDVNQRRALLTAANSSAHSESGAAPEQLLSKVAHAMSIFGACASPAAALGYMLQHTEPEVLEVAESFQVCAGGLCLKSVRLLLCTSASAQGVDMEGFRRVA